MLNKKKPNCPLCGHPLKIRSTMKENSVLRTAYYVCSNSSVKNRCNLKSVSIYEEDVQQTPKVHETA